jgi:hypothetical protein
MAPAVVSTAKETPDKTRTPQAKTVFCAARKSEQIELWPLAQAFAVWHETQLVGGLIGSSWPRKI